MKNKKKKSKSLFRFTVPAVVFLTAVAYVYIWDRLDTDYSECFKGAAAEGRVAECLLELIASPQICLAFLAAILLLTVGFVSAVNGIRNKGAGAGAMLALMLFATAVFAVMLVSLIFNLTS